ESFIVSLSESDLIEVTIVDQVKCIPNSQLSALEKFVRLHNDLEINYQGIEVINRLVNKIDSLQEEILRLRKRLELYE
ncbi:MerR family transcriptional regulator, partial [Marivirga lumbricoides]